MRLWRILTLTFPMLLVSMTACGTVDKRVDPDVNDGVGGGGIESGDVRAMASSFSRDILAWPALFQGGQNPSLYISELKNESSTVINKTIVLKQIQTALVRNSNGKVACIDRTQEGMEAIMRERKAKREGAVSSSGNKELMGSDYIMKGTIQSIEKRGKDLKSAYFSITMELTDLESGRIVWASPVYEFKWVGEKAAIYQ